MQTKKILIVLVAAMMIFAVAQTSRAALNAVDPGPYLAVNGFFPAWYQDPSGLGLAPCTTGPAPPVGTGFCVLIADPFFNPALPVVFPTNWPIEFFYWIADADKLTLPSWIKIFRFAFEGSFTTLNLPPANGNQAVFQRIRFIFTPPVTGTYTITHPFGSKTFNGTAGVQIKDTTDIPLGIALDYTTALTGPEGPFLQWDPAVSLPPVGYIGDAVTPHKVIGSPTGNNFVRVDGPPGSAIGGPGVDFVQTNLFVVAGKISPVVLPTPVTIDRSTYNNLTGIGPQIDVFAKSAVTATLTFNDGTVAANAMAHDSSGRFFGRSTSPIPAAVPPALFPAVTVSGSGAGSPNTASSNLFDVVSIPVAEYSVLGQTLTIEATSSDQVNAPVLTADGTIVLTPNIPIIVPGVVAPPAFVTVTSSKGGSASAPVIILP